MSAGSTAEFGIRPRGFRLPAATHVGAVRLLVGDLERSIRYYQDVLGMRVVRQDPEIATLGPQDEERVLVVLHERAGVRPPPRRGTLGLYHFALLLPDRAALGRFLGHIGRSAGSVGMADHFVSEAIYLSDPDGLGIEVYADRPRSEWRHEGRQLHMTTEPLDVNGVLAAGGGQPWSGMPAGTVMGHIHLHIGSLDQAAEFYHSALGFDKTVWDYPGALFMSAGGYHHHLGTNTWSPGGPPAEDQARLLSWELVVPRTEDADAAAKSLTSKGYAVGRSDEGAWRASDPWGTPVDVVIAKRQ